jgi:hypothetical protein
MAIEKTIGSSLRETRKIEIPRRDMFRGTKKFGREMSKFAQKRKKKRKKN